MSRVGAEVDQWKRLETYRQRYPMETRLDQVVSLERSLKRRQARATLLHRRLDELNEQTTDVLEELRAIEGEIDGSRATGALLIEQIIDEVRTEMGEGWSPTPVRGFRVWSIQKNRVMGNQVHWETPTLEGRCLREIPGEDLPHPVSRCGPPACGIYAVKSLELFAPGVAAGVIHNSVVGVIAMRGKVIEHENGYRAQKATAIALSANDGAQRLTTDDPGAIEDFFANPTGVLSDCEPLGPPEHNPAREFLESAHSKEDIWT